MQVDELPYVDEHAVDIAAGADDVWAALLDIDKSFSGAGVETYARVVGCGDVRRAGPRPLAEGSSMPGFHVAVAVPRSEIVLAGHHRFSTYALAFSIDDLGGGRSRLRAETRAAFPGLSGAVYRALVIGTRGHVVAMRRLLTGLKRTAEQRTSVTTPPARPGRPAATGPSRPRSRRPISHVESEQRRD